MAKSMTVGKRENEKKRLAKREEKLKKKDKEFRGVERCQDRGFHGFREIGIGVDKFLQPPYRFFHVATYRLVCADVQHFFDTAKPRILG